MRTPLRERVEKGAALLDKVYRRFKIPWRDKVDLEKLDLMSGAMCVLGQSYGNFWEGKRRLGIADYNAAPYGFISTAVDSRPLTRAWVRYIEATR